MVRRLYIQHVDNSFRPFVINTEHTVINIIRNSVIGHGYDQKK